MGGLSMTANLLIGNVENVKLLRNLINININA
jgi:hypothetical protein